jgi:hypothetical protein
MSVRLFAWNNSAPTERIYMIFDMYFRKTVEKGKVSLKSDKSNRYSASRPTYVFIISLTESGTVATQIFPFGVNTTNELKNVTVTSDNTGTLVSRTLPR